MNKLFFLIFKADFFIKIRQVDYSNLEEKVPIFLRPQNQWCGPGLDADSTRSVDLESGSESRRTKITHKNNKGKEILCYEVLDVLF
jgi:hypothetical protein